VDAIVAFIVFLRLRKETRLRVKHAIFYNELCLNRLSGIRLATKISLVLRRLLGL
jgi:hypothetical protein